MKAKQIVASQPLKKQTLEVNDEGITYKESAGFGMGELFRFSFDQIDAVVRSVSEPLLAIQIGTTIIKLAIKSGDETHNAVIAEIVAGALKSVAQPAPADAGV
jgi:hypothetical protein